MPLLVYWWDTAWDIFKVRLLFRGSLEFTRDVLEVQKAKVCTCPTHGAALLRNSVQSDGERSLTQREDCIFSVIHIITSTPKHMEGFCKRIYKLYIKAGFFVRTSVPLVLWHGVENAAILSIGSVWAWSVRTEGWCFRCYGKISAGEM